MTFRIKSQSRGRRSCTFNFMPYFVQDPKPLGPQIWGVHCLTRALKKHISKAEQFHPACRNLSLPGKARNRYPETPFIFSELGQYSAMLMGLPRIMTAKPSRSRHRVVEARYFFTLGKLYSPAGIRSRHLIITNNFYCFLLDECHPQACGYILKSCSGNSTGCVTH